MTTERERERLLKIEEIYRRNGDSSFGRWGSIDDHALYSQKVDSRSRTRCHCGCGRRATHLGMANGVCLTMGCEWYIAKWIRANHKDRP